MGGVELQAQGCLVVAPPSGVCRAQAAYGYEPTREPAMAAFARSWRGIMIVTKESEAARKQSARISHCRSTVATPKAHRLGGQTGNRPGGGTI
jgi:hypothetical protein